MGKQLSVEASDLMRAGQADNIAKTAPVFLIVEGNSPLRLDILKALHRRFPGAVLERLHPASDGAADSTDWDRFDLVLVSCADCIEQECSWWYAFEQHRQALATTAVPVLVVLADGVAESGNVWASADICLSADVSAAEFAARLDAQLEVRRLVRQYPLALAGYSLCEVMHDSDNAVIFLAENQQREHVVIKRFKFDMALVPPEALERFMADAMILRQQAVEHGLVKLLDAGVQHDVLYLVMEYVDGVTLKYMLDAPDVDNPAQRLLWFRQITQSLAGLHALGLLHRDLKLSNIMLRADGSLVLLDFGVENQLLLDCGFLQDNEIYCTPFYISPERIIGEAATEQSDLYALGAVLFELLTGEKPFAGGQLAEVLQHHMFSPVPPLPDKFAVYQPLLSAMLAKLPEGRIASAEAVLTWLDESGYQETLAA